MARRCVLAPGQRLQTARIDILEQISHITGHLEVGEEDEDHILVQGGIAPPFAAQTALEVEAHFGDVDEEMPMHMGLLAGAHVLTEDSSIPSCEQERRYLSYCTKTGLS